MFLNKENFFLGYVDYDYLDLLMFFFLVLDFIIVVGLIGEYDLIILFLENIIVLSDVMDLFKSDSELEFVIVILMYVKSVEWFFGVDIYFLSIMF